MKKLFSFVCALLLVTALVPALSLAEEAVEPEEVDQAAATEQDVLEENTDEENSDDGEEIALFDLPSEEEDQATLADESVEEANQDDTGEVTADENTDNTVVVDAEEDSSSVVITFNFANGSVTTEKMKDGDKLPQIGDNCLWVLVYTAYLDGGGYHKFYTFSEGGFFSDDREWLSQDTGLELKDWSISAYEETVPGFITDYTLYANGEYLTPTYGVNAFSGSDFPSLSASRFLEMTVGESVKLTLIRNSDQSPIPFTIEIYDPYDMGYDSVSFDGNTLTATNSGWIDFVIKYEGGEGFLEIYVSGDDSDAPDNPTTDTTPKPADTPDDSKPNTPSTTGGTATPKTGDSTPIAAIGLLAALGVTAAVTGAVLRKRED